jgi:peptide methionine sulfoxide reductase msrA/msrB
MEDILRDVPGVLTTDVGYSGGQFESPTYDDVKKGNTGHAESVRIVFDPKKISYAELLEKWFFRMHDPTTKDQQGNDIGSQYRSAIFTTSDEQQRVAEQVKARVDASGQWDDPVVTEIVAAGTFTVAESYHQDYLEKNPGGYTCHYMRDPVY